MKKRQKKGDEHIYQNDDLAVKSDDVQEFHAHVIGGSEEISGRFPGKYQFPIGIVQYTIS